MDNVKVIFDNGGGITLQLGDWACWYNVPKDAAKDYVQYLQDGNTDGWEGHDNDAASLDPKYDQISNGGYRVYTESEIDEECQNNESNWGNIDDFCLAVMELNVFLSRPLSKILIDIEIDGEYCDNVCSTANICQCLLEVVENA